MKKRDRGQIWQHRPKQSQESNKKIEQDGAKSYLWGIKKGWKRGKGVKSVRNKSKLTRESRKLWKRGKGVKSERNKSKPSIKSIKT